MYLSKQGINKLNPHCGYEFQTDFEIADPKTGTKISYSEQNHLPPYWSLVYVYQEKAKNQMLYFCLSPQ